MARLERLAGSRGLPRPAQFLTEDVVDALQAGDLDEALLFAGRQARRHLRQTPPEPTARREAAAELVADFARLAQLLGADAGLSTSQIQRRLGLTRAFEDDAEAAASPPPARGPSPGKAANGYLGPAADRIAAALAAGRSHQADEMAHHRLEEVFDSGAPVSLQTAIADYRRLLHAGGVRDLDDATVARRLGLDHQS